jgi:DNA-binding MarR family transcriptional regulator
MAISNKIASEWETRFQSWPILLLAGVCLFIASPVLADPWQNHVNKATALSRQIDANETEIRKLIEEKQHTKDPEALRGILHELTEKHKELAEQVKKYETERLHMRFKHPDRDLKEVRQYTRHKLKSLQELEDEAGLDGRLDRVKARVLVTFPVPQVKKPELKIPPEFRTNLRKPASLADENGEEPERVILRAQEPEKTHGEAHDSSEPAERGRHGEHAEGSHH